MPKPSSIAATLAVSLFLLACDRVPQGEIDSARAALEAARRAESRQYAPDFFEVAEDVFQSALAEIDGQNQKPRFRRDYDRARNLLSEAHLAATRAQEEAGTLRKDVRVFVGELLEEARSACDAALASLRVAARGEGARPKLAATKTELIAMTITLAEAQIAFDTGDYLTAEDRAESVLSRATEISKDVRQASARKGSI